MTTSLTEAIRDNEGRDFERFLERASGQLLQPFTERDLRTYDVPADRRTEAAVAIAVADATADHAGHEGGRHPFCLHCEFSAWLLGLPSGNPAGRARRFLLQPRGLPQVVACEEGGSPFLTLAQLRDLPEVGWLFADLIPRGALGYVTGRDGTYKTFLALWFALCVVSGRDWNGRGLEYDGHGRALYLAGEGVRSFPQRIAAWLTHHDVTLAPWQESELVVRAGSVDLFGGTEAYQGLLRFVRDQQPDLIVIDTLNRSAGAAEQNSASDMSVITGRLAELKAAAGDHATVLVVAHTDKADNDARGSSAIEDDADFVLHMRRDDDRVRLTVAKQKDGPDGVTIDLQALAVEDSLVLTSVVPEPTWMSDILAERIKGVLFAVRDGDEPTGAQTFALVKDDGTGKDAPRTTVYRELGELVRKGAVIATDRGRTKTYRLDPSQYPKDVRP
jgi:hypothetical protein